MKMIAFKELKTLSEVKQEILRLEAHVQTASQLKDYLWEEMLIYELEQLRDQREYLFQEYARMKHEIQNLN